MRRTTWTRGAAALLFAAGLTGLLSGCPQDPGPQGSWVEYVRPLELLPGAYSPEDHPGFQGVEVEADRLVFDFDGANPLEVDMVVGGASGGPDGYVRRITGVETLADGRVAVTTMPAEFTDFVGDVHFIYHYNPRSGAAGRPGMLVAPSCESGPCELGSQFVGNFSDATECSGSANLDVNLNPIFDVDFSNTELEVDYCLDAGWLGRRGSCRSRGTYLMAEMRLDGSISVGAELTSSANISGMCSIDLISAFTGGSAPEIPLGGVPIGPVAIAFSLEPVISGCIGGAIDAGEVRAWAEGTITVDLLAGWDSRRGFYSDGPNFGRSASAGIETTRAGGAQLSASVGAGGIFHMRFWGVAGPWARVVGHIGADFEAVAGACDWTVRVPYNVDWQLGADINVGIEAFGVGVSWEESVAYPSEPQFLFGGAAGAGQCLPVDGNVIYQTGGTWGWCESTEPMCDPRESTTVCNGDYLGVNVCPGQATFRWCDGRMQIQRCVCDGTGQLGECGACQDPPGSF